MSDLVCRGNNPGVYFDIIIETSTYHDPAMPISLSHSVDPYVMMRTLVFPKRGSAAGFEAARSYLFPYSFRAGVLVVEIK